MDAYAQSRVYLDESGIDNNMVGNAIEDGALTMNICHYSAADLFASTAGDFTVIANTQPHAPTFTTCGKGDKKSSGSTVKVWTCCYCKNSGMAVGSTPACPGCSHYQCEGCETYKVKSRY